MSWRRLVVGAMLALWLVVGLAWGLEAALLIAYPIFFVCLFVVWAVLAGDMDQRAAAWYYERQLRSGPWRERPRRRG
jgi:hypothetical protein